MITGAGVLWLLLRIVKDKSFSFIRTQLILMLTHEVFELIGGIYLILTAFYKELLK